MPSSTSQASSNRSRPPSRATDGAYPYGYVSYTAGVRSSNADGLYIKFKGRGGHGAMPQETIDPVMMASRFVVDVQSVISREKDPTEFGVVSIGSLHAGISEYINAGVPSMFFNIGVYDPERFAAARNGGPPLPGNHSPLFAPAPKPTIQTN
jgi:metal-dependent amidase/aminoacylase/carboxypeptidase family protein